VIDLDDFREEYNAALKAALEFARRAKKGTPSDRWADGDVGLRLVAEGIRAQLFIMDMQTAALAELKAEIDRARADATFMGGGT
jgi:hypothetical protein